MVKKKGKSYGPYVYESYRDKDGVVRKRYLGKAESKSFDKKFYNFILVFVLFCFVFLFVGIIYTTNSFKSAATDSFENSVKVFAGLMNRVTGLSIAERDDERDGVVEEEVGEPEESGEIGEIEESLEADETEEPPSDETILEELNETIPEELNESGLGELNETLAELNETAEEQTSFIDELLNETLNETIGGELNETLEELDESFAELDVTTISSQIVVNRPVRWIKKIVVNKTEFGNLSLEIPKEASNISVKTGKRAEDSVRKFGEEEKRIVITGEIVRVSPSGGGILSRIFAWLKNIRLTGSVISEDELRDKISEGEDGKEINLTEFVEESSLESVEIAVEYYTPAPLSVETEIPNGKRVVVYAPSELNYTDVLAYSFLREENVPQNNLLRVYSYGAFPADESGELNETAREILEYEKIELDRGEVEFTLYDIDFDGYTDYVQWSVPHLSFQVYEIIQITKAEHLDEGKNFVSDVYESVRERDGVWSEEIPDGHFVRVVFERELNDYNDITIYARAVCNGSILINGIEVPCEIYEKKKMLDELRGQAYG